ncbi:MAG: hypothetical protein M1831_002656 [Alyxoria varia]|nr:MAG: hypothetical protein M1831_002656 [Alyxoria varia]
MRIQWAACAVALFAAENAVASSWFSKAVYNKWHETELERWLSDHDVPYPTPADRKDLENLVKTNWQAAVESPYLNWDLKHLQKHLEHQGAEVKKGMVKDKDGLQNKVKASWQETGDSADQAYSSVKDWIFDSWTDSQLKGFCDKHGIPVPQPRERDSLLKAARENYQTAANKLGETASYPGNWLYDTWSDSELKAWLDERGVPVPQTSNRDNLIATVRRNSRVASLNARASISAASSSAEAAKETLSDAVFDGWSDSQLKEWADSNGIKVPQGSTRNELIAIARKHRAKLTDSAASAVDDASSNVGAATSAAGNEYAKASEDASLKGNVVYKNIMYYVDELQAAIGLKTDPVRSASQSAASASKSISSAFEEASKSAKGEL